MIMWSAVILRIFENGSTRSPGQGSTAGCCTGPDGAAAGRRAPGAAGAGAGAAVPRSMNPKMSCFVTRPASPVPGMAEMSTRCSAAILRTSCVERLRSRSSAVSPPSPSPAPAGTGEGATGREGAAALGVGAAAEGGGAGAVGAGKAAPFSVSITATSVCTGTVCPSCTLISASTPAAGAGISASTLSVEISNSGSSRFTASPSCLSHLLKVPSAMASPIWGMRTSMRAIMSPRGAVGCQLSACRRPTADSVFSVRREPPCSLNDVFRLRQHEVLQRRRIRQRHVVGGHPHDRPVEPFERLLVDAGRDLPGDAPGAGVLVHDQHLVGLLHRAHDRGVVHWQERPEVQHLRRDTVFLLELLRRFERLPQGGAVGDDGQILPFARQPRLADRRHDLLALGELLLDATVQLLVLQIVYTLVVMVSRPL